MRTELTEAEIKAISDYFYAHELALTKTCAKRASGLIRCLQKSIVSSPKLALSSRAHSRLRRFPPASYFSRT